MARTGLSRSQVKACRDRLVAEGRYPSVDAVRAALGNTGSKSTIHRLLKELEHEVEGAGIPRADTAQALHGLVEQLADRLHADAETRMAALREGYEAALRAKDAELDTLRAALARLAARLDQLETGPQGLAPSGLGDFGAQLANPRGGRRDASPFSIVLSSSRSDLFEVDKLRPPRLKLQ